MKKFLSGILALAVALTLVLVFLLDQNPSEWWRFFSFDGSCPQARSFYRRLPSSLTTTKPLYDRLICGLARSGTWAKLDALYIFSAETQAIANLNLVSASYPITVNGGMTWGPLAGYMGDGSTGYLRTAFVSSAATNANYRIGNMSLGVGITDQRQTYSSGTTIGGLSVDYTEVNALTTLHLSGSPSPPNGSTASFGSNRDQAHDAAIANATGSWIGSLTNTNNLVYYHNGTNIATASSANVKLLDGEITIFGLNLPGKPVVIQLTNDSMAWALIGGGLTQSDVDALNALLAQFPVFKGGVPAAHWGFTRNSFNYDFTQRGLEGIDSGCTKAAGFQLYSSFFFGVSPDCIANPAVYSGGLVTLGANGGTGFARLATSGNTTSYFTASIAGTTMTVSEMASFNTSPIAVGQVLAGNSALSGETIMEQLTGTTRGIGTYSISSSVTMLSANIQGSSNVGATFPPGGYYELYASYDPSQALNSEVFFPSFWLQDLSGLYAQNLHSGYGAAGHFAEFDIWEGQTAQPRNPDLNVFDWTTTNGGGFGINNGIIQYYPTGAVNSAGIHSYGMLWVPSTLNGGTGLVQWFMDGINVAQTTYTSGGTPSPPCSPINVAGCMVIAESGNFVLMMQGGGDGTKPYPVNLQTVSVWH
jgi:hypothetical protein